jgi:hypothetical protein
MIKTFTISSRFASRFISFIRDRPFIGIYDFTKGRELDNSTNVLTIATGFVKKQLGVSYEGPKRYGHKGSCCRMRFAGILDGACDTSKCDLLTLILLLITSYKTKGGKFAWSLPELLKLSQTKEMFFVLDNAKKVIIGLTQLTFL